jgi:hypothetical protein
MNPAAMRDFFFERYPLAIGGRMAGLAIRDYPFQKTGLGNPNSETPASERRQHKKATLRGGFFIVEN